MALHAAKATNPPPRVEGVDNSESPHEAFQRIAALRLANARHALYLLGLTADRKRYDYTASDVRAILRPLRQELRDLELKFETGSKKTPARFRGD